MKKLLIVMLTMVTMFSCKTGESAKNKSFEESDANYFSMYRGSCYGKCPSFKIEIHKTGEFVYFGKAHVKNIGKKEGTLKSIEVEKLFEDLSNYNWNSYLDEYPIDNVDFPGFALEYGNENHSKKIQGNLNSPVELIDLTQEIDSLLAGLGL